MEGPARVPDPDLRGARTLRRLRVGVVRRGLRAAHGQPRRLHPAPHQALLDRRPRRPARGTPPPDPAARPCGVRRRREPRAGARGRPRRAAPPALPAASRPHRGRRRGAGGRHGRRRARLPPRGRQPALPPLGHRGARRLRDGRAPRLQGRRHRRAGRRLRQQPHAVRRLRAGLVLLRRRARALLLRRRLLRGGVARGGTGPGDGARLRGRADLPHRARRAGADLRPAGQPPAAHRRQRGLPGRARLRADRHRARRRRRGRLVRADGLPAPGRVVLLLRRGQGAGRRAAGDRPGGLLLPLLRQHRRRPVQRDGPRRQPGALDQRLRRRPRPRGRRVPVGLHPRQGGRDPAGERRGPPAAARPGRR